MQLFSYFEKESDQQQTVDAMPEDNLWTLLRLNPNQVPIGQMKLVPGLLDLRLTHEQLKAEEATVSMGVVQNSMAGFAAAALRVLTVKYKKYPRELRIFYSTAFPYEIAGWEEVKLIDGGEQEVSRATRKATLMNDYWAKNKKKYEPLRQELQLVE